MPGTFLANLFSHLHNGPHFFSDVALLFLFVIWVWKFRSVVVICIYIFSFVWFFVI